RKMELQMATLQQSVADTELRIGRERTQVRLLARALYAQPVSMLALVFESSSVSEAVTRVADLTSAGDRAAATKRALDVDLASQSRQRTQLQGDHDRTVALQKQPQLEVGKLATQIAAQAAGPIPAAAAPPHAPGP